MSRRDENTSKMIGQPKVRAIAADTPSTAVLSRRRRR